MNEKREEHRERELVKALQKGEESGCIEGFNPKKNLDGMHRRYLKSLGQDK
jgi:antitoxin ParD1/3/4